MKSAKTKSDTERANVLRELRRAIVAGATWRYDQLIALAGAAGVTDDEIDLAATAAVRDLLSGAEHPVTGRELTQPRLDS
ncbi:MAG: hypothetical protein WCH84_05780 [Verrucomicrobiota bacterium]